MPDTTAKTLRAGYARADITPELPVELAGHFAWRPRLGRRLRDPLFCRAILLEQDKKRLALVSLDVLCVSEQLHRQLAGLISWRPEQIMLLGTHTHASFGGLFPPPGTSVLGRPAPERVDWLAGRIAENLLAAQSDLRPAQAFFGRAMVAGFTNSRRQPLGPHDDEFRVLTLRRQGSSDIVVVNASGHPVVVSEHDPELVSADWPGELCRRLEQDGKSPLFLPAALGGTSPLFPEFPLALDRHLELLGDLAVTGVARAHQAEQALASHDLQCSLRHLPHPPPRSRALGYAGLTGRLADAALWPLRHWLRRGYRHLLAHPDGVPLHLARLGNLLLVGSAHELGAGLVGEMLRRLRASGREGLVAALADGYAGYLHLPAEYAYRPPKGFRFMTWYENALAVFGPTMADAILDNLAPDPQDP